MSQLTKLMRKYQQTRIIRAVVEYLEDVDIPGPAKKALAMLIIKALYKKTGGKWDREIEKAVSGAIEYTLAEVREWAKDFYPDEPETDEPATPAP